MQTVKASGLRKAAVARVKQDVRLELLRCGSVQPHVARAAARLLSDPGRIHIRCTFRICLSRPLDDHSPRWIYYTYTKPIVRHDLQLNVQADTASSHGHRWCFTEVRR